jgi:hypothetical protein
MVRVIFILLPVFIVASCATAAQTNFELRSDQPNGVLLLREDFEPSYILDTINFFAVDLNAGVIKEHKKVDVKSLPLVSNNPDVERVTGLGLKNTYLLPIEMPPGDYAIVDFRMSGLKAVGTTLNALDIRPCFAHGSPVIRIEAGSLTLFDWRWMKAPLDELLLGAPLDNPLVRQSVDEVELVSAEHPLMRPNRVISRPVAILRLTDQPTDIYNCPVDKFEILALSEQ